MLSNTEGLQSTGAGVIHEAKGDGPFSDKETNLPSGENRRETDPAAGGTLHDGTGKGD